MGTIKIPQIDLGGVVQGLATINGQILEGQRIQAQSEYQQAQAKISQASTDALDAIKQSGDFTNWKERYRQAMHPVIDENASSISLAPYATDFASKAYQVVEQQMPALEEEQRQQAGISLASDAQTALQKRIADPMAGADAVLADYKQLLIDPVTGKYSAKLMALSGYNPEKAGQLAAQINADAVAKLNAARSEQILSATDTTAAQKMAQMQDLVKRNQDSASIAGSDDDKISYKAGLDVLDKYQKQLYHGEYSQEGMVNAFEDLDNGANPYKYINMKPEQYLPTYDGVAHEAVLRYARQKAQLNMGASAEYKKLQDEQIFAEMQAIVGNSGFSTETNTLLKSKFGSVPGQVGLPRYAAVLAAHPEWKTQLNKQIDSQDNRVFYQQNQVVFKQVSDAIKGLDGKTDDDSNQKRSALMQLQTQLYSFGGAIQTKNDRVISTDPSEVIGQSDKIAAGVQTRVKNILAGNKDMESIFLMDPKNPKSSWGSRAFKENWNGGESISDMNYDPKKIPVNQMLSALQHPELGNIISNEKSDPFTTSANLAAAQMAKEPDFIAGMNAVTQTGKVGLTFAINDGATFGKMDLANGGFQVDFKTVVGNGPNLTTQTRRYLVKIDEKTYAKQFFEMDSEGKVKSPGSPDFEVDWGADPEYVKKKKRGNK